MLEKLQFVTIMLVNDLKAKRDEINERGATAVEYGLMVALIAVVIIGAVTALGTGLNAKFNTVKDSVTGAN
ncbi:Flp family type IVb pilin [Nocardioides sp. GCM10028917]|uniref:Flp family type IVb pilin n=1 Tax=Nocardioides sp. GCM10028917 TaxID=3273408 RepID=UPI00361C704F